MENSKPMHSITNTSPPQSELTTSKEEVLQFFREKNPRLNLDFLSHVFDYSREAHKNQLRKSGSPYFEHPIEVAKILADQRLDTTTVSAGLLHDILEDTPITYQKLKNDFGEEIAHLVNGVTKITAIQVDKQETLRGDNFKKMLLSVAKDIRVILIKFADRLHNLRTLEFLNRKQIERIGQETIEIYAPLAHRLGMGRLKNDLEDLAFKHLYPDEYQKVKTTIENTSRNRETALEELKKVVHQSLSEADIHAKVSSRYKHLFSIYKKMKISKKEFDQIYDLLGLRIVTESERECYQALGVIHTLWPPLQGRFKDYIATPKTNMYQSLHTTVITRDGHTVEIQIRTVDMNQTAEEGIAAHWRYKEGIQNRDELADYMGWFRQLLEWQKDMSDSSEFMEYLKTDLFQDEIFVFTPKGKLISLPQGATVLDFAFAVHSELGYACVGAKVEDRILPLNAVLHSGDTVKILTSPQQKPVYEWMSYTKTSHSRSLLKRWFKSELHRQSIQLGKILLDNLKNQYEIHDDLSIKLIEVHQHYHLEKIDDLYEAIGKGKIAVMDVLKLIFPEQTLTEKSKLSPLKRLLKKPEPDSGIKVNGVEHAMFRLAKCCQPIPGDPIFGFLTSERGIVIHQIDCVNSVFIQQSQERKIEVRWDDVQTKLFPIKLNLLANDRKNLLLDITKIITENNINIVQTHLNIGLDNKMQGFIVLEAKDLGQLQKVIKSVKKISDIVRIERATLDQ